jgi:hypothetical protein
MYLEVLDFDGRFQQMLRESCEGTGLLKASCAACFRPTLSDPQWDGPLSQIVRIRLSRH